MTDYVCRKTCQVRIGGKITLCTRGQIYTLDKPNGNFQSINGEVETYQVDFIKASQEELKAAKWKFVDAYKAIKETYDVELTREEGTTRMNVIDQILDARYRAIDTLPIPKVK